MKIRANSKNSRGSVLLVTLAAAVVIGITVVSYLNLTSSQNRAVWRSQGWNSAIPIAEAGVEEALGQLYYCGTNLSANGWTSNTINTFVMSRSVGDGRYVAMISNASPPVIYSTAYVKAPLKTNEISRTIRVNTKAGNPFAQGLVAKGTILFSGGGSLDSFDSSDPNYSTGGMYDPTKRKAGGRVVTNAKVLDSIHVDTAHIYGAAYTGPGGTVTTSSGAVGDLAWNAAHSGIESGYSADNENLNFPDVPAPFTSGYFVPVSGGGSRTTRTSLIPEITN